jgi:hypothetical protein
MLKVDIYYGCNHNKAHKPHHTNSIIKYAGYITGSWNITHSSVGDIIMFVHKFETRDIPFSHLDKSQKFYLLIILTLLNCTEATLCFIMLHREGIWEGCSTGPHILNLNIQWRWSVRLSPWPFTCDSNLILGWVAKVFNSSTLKLLDTSSSNTSLWLRHWKEKFLLKKKKVFLWRFFISNYW